MLTLIFTLLLGLGYLEFWEESEDRAEECDSFIISVLGGEYKKSAYVFENRNHILIARQL